MDSSQSLTQFRGWRLVDELVSSTTSGFEIGLCANDDEKKRVRNFALRLEREGGDRYGLINVKRYKEEYWNLDRFEYLSAHERKSGKLVGDLRLRFDYDPLGFPNLTPEFRHYYRHHKVVDGGAHIDRPQGKMRPIYSRLWAFLITMLQETGAADGIYSQVRPVMLKTFLSMGWQQCSDEFVAPAWNGKWIAMWIDMQDISQNWHSQDFQKKWLARTGVRFDTKLWERVDRVMYTSTFWK